MFGVCVSGIYKSTNMIPERFPEIAAADFNNDNDDIAELLRCLFELIIDENDVGIVDDVSVVVTVCHPHVKSLQQNILNIQNKIRSSSSVLLGEKKYFY
ncbi:hypothetical protein DERP_001173 [Dermatophagoides pteronyssinus]|uniref:Uncharacterized protein n=1 Tax=Dermatophagoides pteronyssinus TaxID=6956 RepID=A0ABQ8JDQ5_DERPT|nr:hypothetical protein DERP_001173 [Dermatophagoides pteronyssinus]